jgi:hypothetical protein
MPRKDSKARHITIASRWLEWRCGAKWQNVVVINTGHYRSEGYEDLVDSFITEEGPTDHRQIAARLAKWSGEDLLELATAAERKGVLFRRGGRPLKVSLDPWLEADVAKIKRRRPDLTDRAICIHLVNNDERYRGLTAEALRQRYIKSKRQRP